MLRVEIPCCLLFHRILWFPIGVSPDSTECNRFAEDFEHLLFYRPKLGGNLRSIIGKMFMSKENWLQVASAPDFVEVASKKDYIFRPGLAPTQKVNKTEAWSNRNLPFHRSSDLWTPSNPNCNPFSYYVCGIAEAKTPIPSPIAPRISRMPSFLKLDQCR